MKINPARGFIKIMCRFLCELPVATNLNPRDPENHGKGISGPYGFFRRENNLRVTDVPRKSQKYPQGLLKLLIAIKGLDFNLIKRPADAINAGKSR